jgi:Flp pilus assembly protein CpaB
MVLAGLLAVILNLALLRGDTVPEMVVVAARDLGTGTRIDAPDLAVVAAPVEGDLADRFTREVDLDSLVGLVVTRPIESGAPVFGSDVRPEAAPDAGRAMSVPVDRSQAVGGALRRGDRVDVIGVDDGVALYIAVGVEVLAVPDSEGSGLAAATSDFNITLAVDDRQAIAIAGVLDRGDVHIVRSTGAPAPEVGAEPGASDDLSEGAAHDPVQGPADGSAAVAEGSDTPPSGVEAVGGEGS